MEKILIDTDVVLNVLLREEPLFEVSAKVFDLLERGNIRGYVTATTMTNIYVYRKKTAGSKVAEICIKKLLTTRGLKFLSVDEQVLRNAEASAMTDFEDAVQAAAAEVAGIDLIVTRNIRDFRHSPVPAMSPEVFLEKGK